MKYIETNEERIQKILNKKNQNTMIRRYYDVLRIKSMPHGSIAIMNQQALLNDATDIEKGLRMMIEGIEHYCAGVSAVGEGYPIGNDYILGESVGDIINGLIRLLNGPGTFDGGTCDAALRAIAKKYEIKSVDQ